jgi:hypothetical protein
MHPLLIIHFSVAIIIIFLGIFLIGYENEFDGIHDKIHKVILCVLFALTWPLLLSIFLLSLPIIGVYYFGKYIRYRNDKYKALVIK